MAAEAWASPKLGFQEMYLCIELLALTDTQLRSVGVQAADAGCCQKGARLEHLTGAVGLGCLGLWGVLGHGVPSAVWGVVHLVPCLPCAISMSLSYGPVTPSELDEVWTWPWGSAREGVWLGQGRPARRGGWVFRD